MSEDLHKSASKRQSQETLQDHEVLKDLVSRIGDGIYITSAEGEILDANPALLEMVGVKSLDELRNAHVTTFLDPQMRAEQTAILKRDGRVIDHELCLRRADGELRWVLDTAFAVKQADGGTVYRGIMRDITVRKRLEAQMLEQSIRDPLTGAFNRRQLETFEKKWKEKTWGCIIFDIDHFKHYNDTWGHHAGDEILIGVSRFLTRQIRTDASLIRLGGDEFLILLPNASLKDTEAAHRRIEQAALVQSPIPFSMGFAARENQEPLEKTIQRADANLYQVRTITRAPNEERRRPQ